MCFWTGSTEFLNKIELVAATREESPIFDYLEKWGEGMHHVAFAVEDISKEMKRLKKEGIRLSPTKKYSGKDKGKVVKRANTTGRGTPTQYRKSHEDPDMGRYQKKVTQGSGSFKGLKKESLWDAYLKVYEHHQKDANGKVIEHGDGSPSSLDEEGYDRMRDDRLVKYGIGHDGSDRKSTPSRRTPDNQKIKGKTVLQKETEKKYGKGVSPIDVVRKKIEAKHGKGAIMDTKKKS